MAEVKWIKLTTDIFDDEKILMIESLPNADTIIVVWFKLLTLAGKNNNNGVFMMNNRIAYTDEMLAAIFRRDEKIVSHALNLFEQFGMIEIIDSVITIPNWDKHQSLDAYEKKKERDRILQAERRARQRALIEKSSDNRLTSDEQSADGQLTVAVSEEEEEKEKEKEKNNIEGEFTPPSLSDVEAYVSKRGDKIDALRFFTYYESNGWKQSGGTPILDWKAAVQAWECKEYRKKSKEPSTIGSFDPQEFFEAAVKKGRDNIGG